ncbi:MAG: creatininase family protein [Clostridia bacterium]|nr:creatininase family protein [Clostridia bacterium]
METRWLHITSENFHKIREASEGVCVIPMGCIEKHGLHLPLGTDILEASGVAYAASQIEPFCVFPDFTFGDVGTNAPTRNDGILTLTVETEMLLLEELCEQISKNGFKKILIMNGHGGNNPWLSTFLRRLGNRKRDYVVSTFMLELPALKKMGQFLMDNGPGSIPELTPEDEKYLIGCTVNKMRGGHACLGETAYIMALYPEDVHLERLGIESGENTHVADKFTEVGISVPAGWDFNYPNAYTGDDPVGCTETIGKAQLRIEAERFARAVKVYKEDTLLLEDNEKRNKNWSW